MDSGSKRATETSRLHTGVGVGVGAGMGPLDTGVGEFDDEPQAPASQQARLPTIRLFRVMLEHI